jgi:ribonuclease HI
MLWGKYAEKYESIYDVSHITLKWLHPSPLAQNCKNKQNKFVNCDHFNKSNELLKKNGNSIINWNSISDEKEEKKIAFNNAKSILGIGKKKHIAFTDGSAYPKYKDKRARGGYAAVFVSGKYNDKCIYGNLSIDVEFASNIRAEGMAIIRVFEKVLCDDEKWDGLTVITDCQLWVNMITVYMPDWSEKQFMKKSNTDLTKKMWLLYNQLQQKGDVKIIHMKSHDKDNWSKYAEGSYEKYCYEQNKYVDMIASFARTEINVGEMVCEDVTYE